MHVSTLNNPALHQIEAGKMSTESQLAAAALDTLHGARGLPSEQASVILRDFLNSIRSSSSNTVRMTEAADALERLIEELEAKGSASDDDWQSSIEAMLSLTNEAS